jgi:hypothetical protein
MLGRKENRSKARQRSGNERSVQVVDGMALAMVTLMLMAD